jgi:hypothetical protein
LETTGLGVLREWSNMGYSFDRYIANFVILRWNAKLLEMPVGSVPKWTSQFPKEAF